MVGGFHPPDGGDRAVFAQQGAAVGLLLFELCGVFGGQHRAAAAVFGAKFAIHTYILRMLAKAVKNHYTTNRKGTATSG